MSRKRKTPSRNPQRSLPTVGTGRVQDRGKVFVRGHHIGYISRNPKFGFHWFSTTEWEAYGDAYGKKDALRDLNQAWALHKKAISESEPAGATHDS